MEVIGIFVAIGCAFIIASVYFYCTYKNIIKYDDSEVIKTNRAIE
jgi:hypothetical protein